MKAALKSDFAWPREAPTLLVYAAIAAISVIPLHAAWLIVFVALIVGGVMILAVDHGIRDLFRTAPDLRASLLLMAFVFAWQVIGLFARGGAASGEGWQAAGNVAAIAMFAVVVVAAMRRDPALARNLLPVAGVIVAAGSLAAILGQAVLNWADFTRLVLYGRANSSVIAAGVLVFGTAASVFALLDGENARKPLLWAALALNGLALGLTFSRGPIVAAVMAAVVLFVTTRVPPGRNRGIVAGVATLVAVALPLILVLNETRLNGVACSVSAEICRGSHRLEIWLQAIDGIRAHPWFGLGPTAEIDNPFGRHPHSGYLGPAFFHGIPVAIAFLALIVIAFRAVLRGQMGAKAGSRIAEFTFFMLAFTMVYMMTDLREAFSFLNAHYLFLWLPAFLAIESNARGVMPPRASRSQH
jgi:O-antigen ligase